MNQILLLFPPGVKSILSNRTLKVLDGFMPLLINLSSSSDCSEVILKETLLFMFSLPDIRSSACLLTALLLLASLSDIVCLTFVPDLAYL